nr:nucleotide disphospho-sugar-binding domain-containing protein [uncultured Desulfobacter sp.]
MNIIDCHTLFLPFTHTISHLSRPLEIAKQMLDFGGRISFAGESCKTKFIAQEGFHVYPLFEVDPDLLFGNIRNRKIKFISDSIIEKMIRADLSLFDKIKPDLVVSDGRFSVMISAQIAGIRHASVVNGSSTAYRAIPYLPFIKQKAFDEFPPKGLIPKLLNPVNLKIEMLMFDNIMCIFKTLSRKYGLHQKVTATNCLCGTDLTLIADIPEFFPTLNLPSDYHYIGPITWKAPLSESFPPWWPPKKQNKTLIYLTMGTTGESGLFQSIYNVLKNMDDVIIVITTGSQSNEIISVPDKVYVTDFMDGDAIMELCDMVICHGGNGTIYQAMAHGIPVIGIPTIPDQDFNMRRVQALGVGKKISMGDALEMPEKIRAAVNTLRDGKIDLSSSFQRIRTRLSSMKGSKLGAEKIKDLILQIV